MPEGQGTVLDNTCLLWLSNMFSGSNHDNSTLPILTLGGLGGTLQTGRVLNYRDKGDRIALLDPATGQDFEVVKDDMSDFKSSPVSPMPAAFETLLPEQEFFDLLEYLRTPAK